MITNDQHQSQAIITITTMWIETSSYWNKPSLHMTSVLCTGCDQWCVWWLSLHRHTGSRIYREHTYHMAVTQSTTVYNHLKLETRCLHKSELKNKPESAESQQTKQRKYINLRPNGYTEWSDISSCDVSQNNWGQSEALKETLCTR